MEFKCKCSSRCPSMGACSPSRPLPRCVFEKSRKLPRSILRPSPSAFYRCQATRRNSQRFLFLGCCKQDCKSMTTKTCRWNSSTAWPNRGSLSMRSPIFGCSECSAGSAGLGYIDISAVTRHFRSRPPQFHSAKSACRDTIRVW